MGLVDEAAAGHLVLDESLDAQAAVAHFSRRRAEGTRCLRPT